VAAVGVVLGQLGQPQAVAVLVVLGLEQGFQ
jgi:hypothetical protein